MRYYIIAGEASGDLHTSNLISEIKRLDKDADFRGWGGDLMHAKGATLVKHYKDLAFMGFVDVIAHMNTIRKNLIFCKKDILEYKPDVVILVDYPGFNLRIAEFVKKHQIKTIYYISPQVWAWKKSRIKRIKKSIDQMLVILPFEKEFYQRYNYHVEFVGHPLLDVLEIKVKGDNSLFKTENGLDQRPIIALLPGSRKQEIKRMLKSMLAVVPYFNQYQFIIAGAPGIPAEYYLSLKDEIAFKVIHAQTYELLQQAEAALVTSGTATLETALLEVPEVVCYKGDKLSVALARKLIKIKYISLVNLILDKPVVTELIQNDLNADQLRVELNELLFNPLKRDKMIADYKLLKTKLGGKGASKKAAQLIFTSFSKSK